MDVQSDAYSNMIVVDNMRVAFRVDASLRIGAGHLMRCLSLAAALSKRGASCHFVSRFTGGMSALIALQGHRLIQLQTDLPAASHRMGFATAGNAVPPHADWLECDWLQDAQQTKTVLDKLKLDWLVVDHYALDAQWELYVQSCAGHLMVIDDLADRSHDCDLLLDFNEYPNSSTRYVDWINEHAECLLGPRYALLREEFAGVRKSQQPFSERARLFIGFGGADARNFTLESLHAARGILSSGTNCDVVVGAAYPHLDSLKSELADPSFRTVTLHVATSSVAALMGQARLAVCGGGVSTWERLCMGLPSLVIAVAMNQVEALRHLDTLGLIRLMGSQAGQTSTVLAAEMTSLWGQPDVLAEMSNRGCHLVDGLGADRVAEHMCQRSAVNSGKAMLRNSTASRPAGNNMETTIFLAPLDLSHVPRLTNWKNDRNLAHQIAAHPAQYSEDDVRAWLLRNSADQHQVLLGIFDQQDQEVIGVARLMFIDWISQVAELGVFIGDSAARGRRRGQEAVGLLLKHAFMDLGLERVYLRVMSDNLPAMRCYEACGFVREGTLRSHFVSEGARYDMLVMGILRNQYLVEYAGQ